jgi:general stress protein CsbA
MSKPMALFFAVFSVLLMCVTAISISYNGWLAALFFLLTMCSIVAGFIVNAKMRRRREG